MNRKQRQNWWKREPQEPPVTLQTAEEARKFRLTVKLADLLVKETQKRLDVVRLVLRCEERERQCMNHEEVAQRNMHMKREQLKYRSLIREQDDISRRFTRLQLALALPPPILARTRFMMGEELQGGGLRVHCQVSDCRQDVYIVTEQLRYRCVRILSMVLCCMLLPCLSFISKTKTRLP
jgi:hypothetical protein